MKIILFLLGIILYTGCLSFHKARLDKLTSNSSIEIKEKTTDKNIILSSYIGDKIYVYNMYHLIKTEIYKNSKPISFPKPYYSTWTGIGFDFDTFIRIEADSFSIYRDYYSVQNNNKEIWTHYKNIDKQSGGVTLIYPTYFIIIDNKIVKLSFAYINKDQYDFVPPIPVDRIVLEKISDNIFSYELIYQGIQNNSIVLAYREYSEDRIREKFSQTVYYKINDIKDNIIQYKNIKIKIIEYNNLLIKYSVID